MRISDWSSDLCSSDLRGAGIAAEHDAAPLVIEAIADRRLDRAVIDWKGGDRQPVRPIDGRRPGRHRKGQGDRARGLRRRDGRAVMRSEEHTSELQSLMRISYAVFCLKKKKKNKCMLKTKSTRRRTSTREC